MTRGKTHRTVTTNLSFMRHKEVQITLSTGYVASEITYRSIITFRVQIIYFPFAFCTCKNVPPRRPKRANLKSVVEFVRKKSS